MDNLDIHINDWITAIRERYKGKGEWGTCNVFYGAPTSSSFQQAEAIEGETASAERGLS